MSTKTGSCSCFQCEAIKLFPEFCFKHPDPNKLYLEEIKHTPSWQKQSALKPALTTAQAQQFVKSLFPYLYYIGDTPFQHWNWICDYNWQFQKFTQLIDCKYIIKKYFKCYGIDQFDNK